MNFRLTFVLSGVRFIWIPIKSRVVRGFNPTNGSRKKYVFREMDVQAVGFRLYGNWTECVSVMNVEAGDQRPEEAGLKPECGSLKA